MSVEILIKVNFESCDFNCEVLKFNVGPGICDTSSCNSEKDNTEGGSTILGRHDSQ